MLKKSIFTKFVFAAAVIIAAATSANALEPKIVVIDIQRIMKDSLAAKDLRAQIDAQKDKYQEEIKTKEDKLKKEEEDLAKQKSILAKDALTQKQKAFVDEFNAFRKDVQDKRLKLDNENKAALDDIQAAIQDIVNDLAKEQGFNIAIPASQLIFAHKDFDISAEVLKRLDKKLPKVTLKSNGGK